MPAFDRATRQFAAEVFAAIHRWRRSPTWFSLRQLRTGSPCRDSERDRARPYPLRYVDRPEFFRQRNRPYRPAAVVTHICGSTDDLAAICAQQGLTFEILPCSWYSPDTTAVVLRAARPVATPIPERASLDPEDRVRKLHAAGFKCRPTHRALPSDA